jgi:hypothetical protein
MAAGVIADAVFPVVFDCPDTVREFKDRRAGFLSLLALVVVKRDRAGKRLVLVKDGDIGWGGHEYFSADDADSRRLKIKKATRKN